MEIQGCDPTAAICKIIKAISWILLTLENRAVTLYSAQSS